MKSYKKILTALFSTVLLSHSINAQTTLSTFENGLTTGTKYIDTWEQSPFNIGSCVNNTVAVIDNPYSDNMNPTEKVLYFVRPYYSGDKSGVEVVLENPFVISANRQYIHVLIHKPTATRVYIEGFDGDNVSQFQSLSSSDMRPNAWSDAIFEARGNGYQIERLVIYPDVETPLGRINSDLNIYIDEIIVSSSSTPRTVVDFCRPNGTKTESRYLSELKTSNALLDLNDNFSSVPEKLYSKYNKSAIVAAPGSSFSLQFKQKSTQSTQEAWNAYVYADFNGDKEFVSSTEIIGQATSTLQDDEYIFNIDVNVPAGTPLSSCVLRIKLDDANGDNSDIASHESCSDVTDGMVLDIPLEIANYADRAIVNISGVTAQSGWGTIRILGIDGNEVKVNNGTMLTVVASPYVGYTFEGWYNASTGGLISNEAEFTFSAEFNINLLAKFEEIPYCIPTGELPIEAWFGKIKITPENSSELYYIGSTSSEVNTINSNIQNLSILGGVNIKRNTTFNLGLVKATSSTSISAMKANVWVDWNGDHEFSADEYVSSFDLNNIDNILNITVPAENTITGNTYIRLILSDTEIKNSDACEGVGTGVVYDLLVNIAPNDNERFSITATSSINGAATFTLSPAPGEDGKYPAGTNVEITCVPVSGFEFSQWLKDGMPYGATMTSNNPLPLTALYEDLNLTMKMSAMMPTYCTGTAPNNGDGYHYGISSGSLSVNDVKAFDFALSGQAIADLSQTCIADVCPGDEIQLYVSGGYHTTWSQGIVYIDWNMDGVWDTNTEAYELFNNPGATVSNHLTTITVPEDLSAGSFGIRICSGEAPAHNSLGGGPCQARKRGTLFTFRINSTELPQSDPKLSLMLGSGCSVTITDELNNIIENRDVVVPGSQYEITVEMTDDKYIFERTLVNGNEISMTENGTVYTGTFIPNSQGASVQVITDLAPVTSDEYCEPEGTLRRTDRPASQGNDNRYLTSATITGATLNGISQTFSFTDFSRATNRSIYEKHLDVVLNCSPGDVLSPTLNHSGTWMHKYLYIDWGRDNMFDVGEAGNWLDLVSFNYIDGVNSVGNTTSENGAGAMGSFTVPADADGTYRMRFKTDWAYTDACGRFTDNNDIRDNGGAIADFTLNVHNTATGISGNMNNQIEIKGGDKAIIIKNRTNSNIYIYSISGKLLQSISSVADTTISMESGMYIVKVIVADSVVKQKVIVY